MFATLQWSALHFGGVDCAIPTVAAEGASGWERRLGVAAAWGSRNGVLSPTGRASAARARRTAGSGRAVEQHNEAARQAGPGARREELQGTPELEMEEEEEKEEEKEEEEQKRQHRRQAGRDGAVR